MIWRLCTLMFLIVCASTSSARTYEKNDLPCVIEICLGDGLPELQKIKWERGQSPLSTEQGPNYVGSLPISPWSLQGVKRTFRGRVAEAAPYLALSATRPLNVRFTPCRLQGEIGNDPT